MCLKSEEALLDRQMCPVDDGVHKGKGVIDFKGVPVTLVAQWVQALQAQLPPQPEVTLAQKAPPSN